MGFPRTVGFTKSFHPNLFLYNSVFGHLKFEESARKNKIVRKSEGKKKHKFKVNKSFLIF